MGVREVGLTHSWQISQMRPKEEGCQKGRAPEDSGLGIRKGPQRDTECPHGSLRDRDSML